MVVEHFVHVVGGHWAYDVLVLFIVPHGCVFVETALVYFVEGREHSRLIVSLLLLSRLLLLLRLSNQ